MYSSVAAAFTYSCIIQSDCRPSLPRTRVPANPTRDCITSGGRTHCLQKGQRSISLTLRRAARLTARKPFRPSIAIQWSGQRNRQGNERRCQEPGQCWQRKQYLNPRSPSFHTLSLVPRPSSLSPRLALQKGSRQPHLQIHSIMDEMALISSNTTQLTETNVHSVDMMCSQLRV